VAQVLEAHLTHPDRSQRLLEPPVDCRGAEDFAGAGMSEDEILTNFALRTVHLATALELGDEEVVLVTWDQGLARASEQVDLGLACLG
jgi:hypothetical protein